MSQAVQIKVLDRTYSKGRGWVVTPKRFLDLGCRDAVEQIGNMIVRQAWCTHPEPQLKRAFDSLASLCAVKVLLAFAALHLDCARSAQKGSLSVRVGRTVGAQNKVNNNSFFTRKTRVDRRCQILPLRWDFDGF